MHTIVCKKAKRQAFCMAEIDKRIRGGNTMGNGTEDKAERILTIYTKLKQRKMYNFSYLSCNSCNLGQYYGPVKSTVLLESATGI